MTYRERFRIALLLEDNDKTIRRLVREVNMKADWLLRYLRYSSSDTTETIQSVRVELDNAQSELWEAARSLGMEMEGLRHLYMRQWEDFSMGWTNGKAST